MSRDPKFYTKDGRLTPYALACGYIEKLEIGPKEIRLWHEGGPGFHVRLSDSRTVGCDFWETFDHLSKARRFFDRAAEQLRIDQLLGANQ